LAEVDNKVVSITFDNALFERKMSETIASLDKLRNSIDMAGAKQGLTELSNASKGFDMTHMGSAIEGVSAKFLGLATVGITALANLTNRVVDAGIQFGKAFSVAPVTAGFNEFELKMGSIQTIMAGSGASLGEVNQRLNELNTYSDKTIYSFQDMTSNIGKFTNAGVSLKDSVGAIQGVANVAAVSGANAEEASRAMYNFGQALSAGHVKLMDWKSIELANMGTVEFKQQLIDSGLAMGTLKKSADGTIKTLKGTEVTTKNFNTTLTDQWLTSEALTKTLGNYSNTQTAIGKKAEKAATQVKTFSQMMDTMKEGLQSGWAQTFEHIFGDFNEGVELWTNIKGVFDDIIGESATRRNEMLAGWKAFGARDALMEGFKEAFKGFGTIIKPITEAFREIFPRKTTRDLVIITDKFRDFAKTIKISGETAKTIKTFFKAFFAVIDIGWEIVKGIIKVFFSLGKAIFSVLGPLLGLLAGNTSFVSSLHETLVTGGGIAKFFDMLAKVITAPFRALQKITGAVADFVKSISFGDKAKEGVEETGESLEKTASLAERLLSSVKNVFGQIGEFFAGIGKAIGGAFEGLGGAIASALGSGNFNNVLNVLKVGLLGGILVYIRKFFKNGLKLDFGQGKLFDKIGDTFQALTSHLKTMQAEVRSDILLKIAVAMGILTVAIVALSLIDSGALTKALAAMAVGFAQLTTVMLVLEKSAKGGGALKILAMSVALVALAAAMTLLVIPILILSKMDWDDLIKGLAGTTAGMLVMATAIQIMGNAKSLTGIFRAAAAMILISVALIVLAKAIKAFAEMNLADMAWGLAQAALGITLLILALRNMPDDIAKKGLGLLILAFSLKSLARVVQLFAGIALGTLAKGFIAISLGLAYIGNAMRTFPDDMIKKAAGLVIASAALMLIGKAVEQIGSLPIPTLIKGIVALNYLLGTLVVSILLLSNAKGGVGTLILAAGALLILGHAIEQVGGIPIGELIKGIAGLAAILAVLAIASVVAPGLFLLGVALAAIGVAFALFGAGALLAARAFELIAKYGAAAMGHITEAMQEFIHQLPMFISAFVTGLIDAGIEIGKQFPRIVDTIVEMLRSLLVAIQDLAPELADTLIALVQEGLRAFEESVPEFVSAGFALLVGFLTGIRDNIGEIVTLVGEIVVNFLEAFQEEVPNIVEALTNTFITIITEVAFQVGRAIPRLMIGIAANFIAGFIQGLRESIGWFLSGFGIFSPSRVMMDIGKNIIQGLIDGIKALFGVLRTIFVELPKKVLSWMGNVARTLWSKGTSFIGGLLGGIGQKAKDVASWFGGVAGKVLGWIGNTSKTLASKGIMLISGLLGGLKDKIGDVTTWVTNLPGKILGWLGNTGSKLVEAGKDLIRGLWGGINEMKDWVMDKVKGFAGSVVDGIKGFFGIGSPSKVFKAIGANLGESLGMGLRAMGRSAFHAAEDLGDNVTQGWERARVALAASVSGMDEFTPTITPVLDLSKVVAEAKNLDKVMDVSAISPDVSIDRANAIALSTNNQNGSTPEPVPTGPTEIKYEQNIYAPTALSTADIYRQTKSQIALKKEELEVA
jgi:tape measure domain-containing protein